LKLSNDATVIEEGNGIWEWYRHRCGQPLFGCAVYQDSVGGREIPTHCSGGLKE
jgi:hypothetical protein